MTAQKDIKARNNFFPFEDEIMQKLPGFSTSIKKWLNFGMTS